MVLYSYTGEERGNRPEWKDKGLTAVPSRREIQGLIKQDALPRWFHLLLLSKSSPRRRKYRIESSVFNLSSKRYRKGEGWNTHLPKVTKSLSMMVQILLKQKWFSVIIYIALGKPQKYTFTTRTKTHFVFVWCNGNTLSQFIFRWWLVPRTL